MKRIIMLASSIILSTTAAAESTQEMLSACRPIGQGQVVGDSVNFPQTFETGICWGAFLTIQQAIVRIVDGRPVLRACAPTNSTRTQLIAVFIAYAEKAPAAVS